DKRGGSSGRGPLQETALKHIPESGSHKRSLTSPQTPLRPQALTCAPRHPPPDGAQATFIPSQDLEHT
ncbi:hypothetical protein NDU88_001078, partial [Pleurodeles waltl]